MDAATVLRESVEAASDGSIFDIFLCHSIRDAELVLGAKRILERQNLTVYVDWIVDPKMDRSSVTARTADVLRKRMGNSKSLLYLYSENSTRSRWMPWELGFFDGRKGAVAVIPIEPEGRAIDFGTEEYLGLYPKVEITTAGIFVNRTSGRPVPASDQANYRSFDGWLKHPTYLRP